MSKLEEIRQACIKANPEIVELKTGCEIYNTSLKKTFVVDYLNKDKDCFNGHYKNESNGTWIWKNNLGDFFEILGRPIRLADVLILLGSKETNIKDEGGQYGLFREEIVAGKHSWNLLKDDLTLQSPETIDFIHSIQFK